MSTTVGFIYAVVAAICNGSFLVPYKLPQIVQLKIHPVVFQLYAAIGICLVSFLAAAFLPLSPQFVSGSSKAMVFVPLAFLSGVIMILSMTFSFLATKKIGVALAQGIFGGLAIVVSYIWALLVFKDMPSNIFVSIFGMIVLVTGIVGIAWCKLIAFHLTEYFNIKQKPESHDSLMEHIVKDRQISEISMDFSLNIEEESMTSKHSNLDYILGLIYAIVCGLLGGTSLVPLHYVSDANSGLNFLPSFGAGVLITAPFVLALYFKLSGEARPVLRLNDGAYAGIFSGAIWSISYIFSIGAIPILGYGVAFPLIHASVLISGLWGIYLFKEFRLNYLADLVFFVFGGLLIGGATMISVSK